MSSIWDVVKRDLTDKAFKTHEGNIKKYGLLPPGFSVEESDGKPQYVNPDTMARSPDHPLKGIDINSAAKFQPEPSKMSLRVEVRGVSHPVPYMAGEWKWEYYEFPAQALFVALVQHGVLNKNKEGSYKARVENLSRDTGSWNKDPLYHPGDQQHTMVYNKERLLAKICLEYQRELIIISSDLKNNGKGRQFPYFCKPELRSPVRLRRSVGQAEIWPPIVLGCILPFGAQDATARWYNMVPSSSRTKGLYDLWDAKCDWSVRRHELGLSEVSDLKTVQWLAVSAHRAVLNGEIKETQLGPFIQALLKHFNAERSKPYGKRSAFGFNPRQEYKGPSVHFVKLSAYIVTSGAISWARHYIEKYDNVMEAIDRGEHKKNPKAFINAVKELSI